MGALAGRRVVVTRSADQADELANLLRAAGAVPVVVPLIEIVTDPEQAALLAAANPAAYDWLVVTSPNGALHYVGAHGSAAPPKVAAVGASTAAALNAAGIAVTLVPAHQRAAGLLAEFPVGTGRVLVVQARDAEPTLVAGLVEKGWQVTALAPYRSVPAHPTAGEHLAALAADAVLFASGSAARAWVAVFGDSSPPIVVAIGPQTADAAGHAGLKVALVVADHSLSGLVTGQERHLSGTE